MSTAIMPYVPSELTTSEVVELFLRGRSRSTVDAYRTDLQYFSTFLRLPDSNAAAQALLSNSIGNANRLAYEFRASMLESGLSPNTINRRLATLRSLCKLARTVGLITWTLDVENVKARAYRDTRGPQESGFSRILAASDARHDAKGIRDKSIILLLHDVALRRSEVVSLDVQDVDPFNRSIAVMGKGRHEKQAIRLPERTWAALAEWLDVREWNPGPLFINCHRAEVFTGKRLTSKAVYMIIQAFGKVTGQRVTPHGLRHTAITTAVERAQEANIDLSKVLQFSRHASLSTLQIYADRHKDWQGTVAELVAR